MVHCLFELSTRKEYVEPLRAEVKQCVQNHGGWTKMALESMKKLDSFVKECQRHNNLDAGNVSLPTSSCSLTDIAKFHDFD